MRRNSQERRSYYTIVTYFLLIPCIWFRNAWMVFRGDTKSSRSADSLSNQEAYYDHCLLDLWNNIDIWNNQELPKTESPVWVAFNISITTFLHTIQGQILFCHFQTGWGELLQPSLQARKVCLGQKIGPVLFFGVLSPSLLSLFPFALQINKFSLEVDVLSKCIIQRK